MTRIYVDGEWIIPIAGGSIPFFGEETEVTPRPPSPEEEALQQLSLREARGRFRGFNLESLFANPELALSHPELLIGGRRAERIFGGPGGEALRGQLEDALARTTSNRELEDLARENIRARLSGERLLSPEEEKLLDQLYASSRAEGIENLRIFGDELAGGRGLRTSDSPIGNELLRQYGRLELGLQSARAGSALDLGNQNLLFNQGLQQFSEGLRQQAFQNRLALSNSLTSPLQGLQGIALGNQARGFTQTYEPGLGTAIFGTVMPAMAQQMQGIGSMLQGVGSITPG